MPLTDLVALVVVHVVLGDWQVVGLVDQVWSTVGYVRPWGWQEVG